MYKRLLAGSVRFSGALSPGAASVDSITDNRTIG